MSATRPRPAIGKSPEPGKGNGAAKFTRNHVSPEGRERLSELAKRRHAEGGFQKIPGGGKKRAKKPSRARIARMVAESAREKKNAQNIIEVFKDGIDSNQPMHIRLKAAEAWLKIDLEDEKLALKEDATESEKLGRDQLLNLLSEKLTSGHAANMLRSQIEDRTGIRDGEIVIEGHVRED